MWRGRFVHSLRLGGSYVAVAAVPCLNSLLVCCFVNSPQIAIKLLIAKYQSSTEAVVLSALEVSDNSVHPQSLIHIKIAIMKAVFLSV